MVFILSDAADVTTNFVIDWLSHFDSDFIRFNREDQLFAVNIKFGDSNDMSMFLIDNEKFVEIELNSVKSFWYRRGDFMIGHPVSKELKKYQHILSKEWSCVKEYLHFMLEQKKSLGSFFKEHMHNKLITLQKAKDIGLLIPQTAVLSNKEGIGESKLITKSIGNIFMIQYNGMFQSVGTQRVEQRNLDDLGDWFFPTLFQNEVEKEFEARIFFINDEYYAMAIFSQLDDTTSLDFRNYNMAKPNRVVPYSLPNDVKNKLQALMQELDLNTGSIDMIVTPEGDHVFLEVNPTGQFGWVSHNCNYFIEKRIASWLSEKS